MADQVYQRGLSRFFVYKNKKADIQGVKGGGGLIVQEPLANRSIKQQQEVGSYVYVTKD